MKKKKVKSQPKTLKQSATAMAKVVKKKVGDAVKFVKEEVTGMQLDSLQKLYLDELRDLYSAENQLIKALPKMAKAATDLDLKAAFETHLEETKVHAQRLEQIFEMISESPKGKTCAAMKGLVEEGQEMIAESGLPAVKDAGLIACAQRVEHYEMAGYGCVRTYAEMLGSSEAAEILQQTLAEEKSTDAKLSDLALSVINLNAAEANDGSTDKEEASAEKAAPARQKKSKSTGTLRRMADRA